MLFRSSNHRSNQGLTESSPIITFLNQHVTNRMKVPTSEEFNVLTIDVFDDDDESLHFPEEDAPEVDQVHLRSGRQLVDPHPPHRKEPRNKDVAQNETMDPPSKVSVKYDVISHLKKIPAMLSLYDALSLSSDLRKALVTAVSFPEDYRVEVSQIETKLSNVLNITFSDEDMLLGSKKHNRPLVMFG